MTDALSHFSAPVRDWFRATFSAPTAAQEGAWESIRNGNNTLIIAPTGSGKTLAAFLWSLDRLASTPLPADADPLLPLHRYQLDERLTEIRIADLAFTAEERATLSSSMPAISSSASSTAATARARMAGSRPLITPGANAGCTSLR